jgi:VanZ family protein
MPGLPRTHSVNYEVRMLDKLTAIGAWTLLAFIAFATVSPIHDRPTLAASSSIEHLAAFAVLGVLFCVAYRRQIAFVCLVVVGSAVVLECVQLLTPDRHGRVEDALEKIAGGAAGIVIGRAIVYFARTNRFGNNARGS